LCNISSIGPEIYLILCSDELLLTIVWMGERIIVFGNLQRMENCALYKNIMLKICLELLKKNKRYINFIAN
jgi:hypothetical protein